MISLLLDGAKDRANQFLSVLLGGFLLFKGEI